MKRKILTRFLLLSIILIAVFVQFSITGLNLFSYKDGLKITTGEIESLKPKYPLTMSVERNIYSDEISLNYKFLNLFTIKSIKADLVENNYVYLGGKPLGITLGNNGVIISGIVDVITDYGLESPCKGCGINAGDVLLKIDDFDIFTAEDISKILSNCKDTVKLTLKQKSGISEVVIKPVQDALTKSKKLGISIQNCVSGVGTLTFINPDDGRYGALGHQISDGSSTILSNATGNIYNCNVIGSVKSERGKPGELKGVFNKFDSPIGSIDKNSEYGIFGFYNADYSDMEKIDLGNRFGVKNGKAQIYTTIYGETPQLYDIDIVKANKQDLPDEKGMVINVTDKRLLEKTGGIVQGMSGSPIIQDGKLIGAVSHVFISDPSKGYGMYIDWMVGN